MIYTVGHSTRPINEFTQLMQSYGVSAVIDIRTVPRSRTNPQYNADVLARALSDKSIAYFRIAELGGLRKKSKTVPFEANAFWQNASFHNYADYALSDAFEEGLRRLVQLSKTYCCAIMCSEAVWWRCHRRIVADYLLTRQFEVSHIFDERKSEPASVTSNAQVLGSRITYPLVAKE